MRALLEFPLVRRLLGFAIAAACAALPLAILHAAAPQRSFIYLAFPQFPCYRAPCPRSELYVFDASTMGLVTRIPLLEGGYHTSLVVAPDGSNAVQLTNFGARQTGSPHWSPDGRQLAFDARPDAHSDIYVIDAQGGKPRRITNSGKHDAVVPNWSHDGRWIYYASNAGGDWDLWKTPLDGSRPPAQITTHGGFAPFESADGKTLFYAKWNQSGIFSMPVDGGPEALVTGELLPGLWRYWSLSDKCIYLIRPGRQPNSPELIPVLSFLDFQTRKIVDLRTLDKPPKQGPGMSISPDGKVMLVCQPDDGGSEIMIVENFR